MRSISILLFTMALSNGARAVQMSDFGSVIGVNGETVAYSNKSDKHVSKESHHITLNGKKVYAGMKWQCVEYARRWLLQQKGLVLPDVEYATDIWNLKSLRNLIDEKLECVQCINGISHKAPSVGDLLIYNNSFVPVTGHVAVIVAVKGKAVYVAEQNWSNAKWDEPSSHSRKLKLKNGVKKGLCSIEGEGIIGWIGVKKGV